MLANRQELLCLRSMVFFSVSHSKDERSRKLCFMKMFSTEGHG
jgi:hypothetical protein